MKPCSKCKEIKTPESFTKSKITRSGLESQCRACKSTYKKKPINDKTPKERAERLFKLKIARKKYFASHPWAKAHNTSTGRRTRYNREHTLSVADFKELWFRDKAWLLKRPSIDRIDNSKGYIPGNCRYIELSENTRLGQLITQQLVAQKKRAALDDAIDKI